MSSFRTFSRNLVLSALSESSSVFLFLLLIFAARYLGDENYGIFSFALAFVGLFEIINDCGLRYLLVREISRDTTNIRAYWGNVFALNISLSFVGLLAVLLVINIIPASPEAKMAVYILEGAAILRTLKFLFRYSFHALNRFDLAALSLFIERLFLFIVGIIVLTLGYGVIAFATAFLIVKIVDIFLVFVLFNRYFWLPLPRYDFPLWPKLLLKAIPFALTGVFMLIFTRIDTIMIGLMRSNEEVGWYNVATKLIEAASIVPVIITNSLFPSLSVLHHESREAFNSMFNRGVKYALLVSIPIAIIGNIIAHKLIIFTFGAEYANSVIVFKILLLSVIFSFIVLLGGTALGSINKQKIAVWYSAIVLALNIILNLILIPRMGHIGAGIASLISFVTLALLITIYLGSKGYKVSYFRLSVKPLVGSLLVGSLLMGMKPIPVVAMIIMSILIYPLIITLLRVWSEEEIMTFKKYCMLLVSRLGLRSS